jgi:hypothetical protein
MYKLYFLIGGLIGVTLGVSVDNLTTIIAYWIN